MVTPNSPGFRRKLYGVMLLAFVLRLVYMLYTHRTWEDGLIMALHTEDFVRGLGLTHPVPPGDGPVQGFTSPMSVLITLCGDLMHLGFGLTFLKIVSMFAAAGTVWMGAQLALELGLSEVLALIVATFLAMEHHQILWGMAGMETQVLTLCYLYVLLMAFRGKPWQKGVSLGLAMLGRPDAAFLVLLVVAFEAWQARQTKSWSAFPPMCGCLVLLYGPWLLFATLYYGSAVPNTIVAKEVGYPTVLSVIGGLDFGAKFGFVAHRFLSTLATLGPTYGGNGTGFPVLWDHRLICFVMLGFLLFGMYIAMKRRDVKALLVFAFVLMYAFYLTLAANLIFSWYTLPVAAAGVLCAMYGLGAALSAIPDVRLQNRVAIAAGAVYLLCLAAMLPFTMRSDKYVQKNIETGVREKMGLYLHDVSYPQDTIASESLGYVGYYSQRVIYDYPGLCSREVVQYLRTHPQERNFPAMIQHLQPSYIVLRRGELSEPQPRWLQQNYDLVQDFKVTPEIEHEILLPQYNVDKEFYVFRHKGIPSHPAPAVSGNGM